MRLLPSVSIGLLSLGALSAPAAPDASVAALMKAVVEPASTLVFAVSGEADPENGPPPPVLSDARWLEGAAGSAKLQAVADAMLRPGQLRPGPVWLANARIMSESAAAAQVAAKAHDGAAFTKVVNTLGDTCKACHDVYAVKRAG